MPTKNKIIPLLVYEDIEKAHGFLVAVFGFTPGLIHRTPEGRVVHAEVHLGEITIWLHRVAEEVRMVSPRSLPMAYSGLVIHVPDVDAHYAQAIAHGAKVEGKPEDKPYGQREYGVRDIEGHRWWFATPLA